MPDSILIIDDERNYLLILSALLEEQGYAVTALDDPAFGLTYLEESEVDVVITDMKMPGMTGQQVLDRVRHDYPYVPVLIMTAFGSIEAAVDAMRQGAFDYITKPFSNDELLMSVAKAVEFSRAQRTNRLLVENLSRTYGTSNIVGGSKAMQRVLALVERAAPSKSTVLITGESGTGKELIAKAIHFASPRKDKPFVSVNVSALNPNLVESELFGHEKGSFSGATAMRRGRFELAQNGTLFLDEIGELSLDLQVKLLRVLQEKRFERVGGVESIEVDFRLVAATNKDLQQAVQDGTFREDLYYRLNVVHIDVPPLRERSEDVPQLAVHFLHRYAGENDKQFTGFTPEALTYLQGYGWPGNVRQLENAIERSVVLADGDTIDVDDLPAEIKDEESQFKSAVDLLPAELVLPETLEKIEAALVRRALAKSGFVQVKAAKLLGISKSLLQYKLKKYEISLT